MKCMYCTK